MSTLVDSLKFSVRNSRLHGSRDTLKMPESRKAESFFITRTKMRIFVRKIIKIVISKYFE